MKNNFPKFVGTRITSGIFFLKLTDEPNGFHEAF